MEAFAKDYLDWLRAAGVAVRVAEDLRREEDRDPDREGDFAPRLDWHLGGPDVMAEQRDVASRLGGDHATASVLAALPETLADQLVWEVGCGTGVLALAAALRGAEVHASEIDPRALALAARNAEAMLPPEARARLHFHRGPLLDPLPRAQRPDLVIANLPHKPVPEGASLRAAENGGRDGLVLHRVMASELPRRLAPGGAVLLFLHSLPHPELLRGYAASFQIELLAYKRRWLGKEEYPELIESFRKRSWSNTSYLREESGREFLVGGTWRLTRKGER